MPQLDEHANMLWKARQTGQHCNMLSNELTLSDAYAIQFACTRLAPKDDPVIGYKIGATTSEVLTLLNLDEPFYGAMHQSHLHELQGERASTLPLFVQHEPRIEAEIVVCLKSDLVRTNTDLSIDDVSASIDWVAPGLEIVAARMKAPDGKRGLFAVADFGANQHMLIGPKHKDWQAIDLSAHAISIAVGNQTPVEGHSGMSIFGNPIHFVSWFLNHPSRHGEVLKAGSVISCGTCTGALPLADGDSVIANFGSLGTLNLNIKAI